MAFLVKSPAGRANFGVFWDEDTNPGPMKESYGNRKSVILWNPEQPEFGPVYHLVVNFTRLSEKQKCEGPGCAFCVLTQDYTRYLREKGVSL